MRITIDTDDKGKVNIDTGDKGNDRPGLFESTPGIPVIDAGPAPIQEIERARKGNTAVEVPGVPASLSPEDHEAQLPLNPLRAGAAAAYQRPDNLRKKSAEVEVTLTAKDRSGDTIDGGSAQIPEDKD